MNNQLQCVSLIFYAIGRNVSLLPEWYQGQHLYLSISHFYLNCCLKYPIKSKYFHVCVSKALIVVSFFFFQRNSTWLLQSFPTSSWHPMPSSTSPVSMPPMPNHQVICVPYCFHNVRSPKSHFVMMAHCQGGPIVFLNGKKVRINLQHSSSGPGWLQSSRFSVS